MAGMATVGVVWRLKQNNTSSFLHNFIVLQGEIIRKYLFWRFSVLWSVCNCSKGTCQVQSESTKPHESRLHTTTTKNVNYEIRRSPFHLLLVGHHVGLCSISEPENGNQDTSHGCKPELILGFCRFI